MTTAIRKGPGRNLSEFTRVVHSEGKQVKREPEYLVSDFIKFKVTGVKPNGTQFPAIVTENYHYANSINLYRGTLWGLLKKNNKWKKLKEVYNY